MIDNRTKVALTREGNRRENVFNALDLVRGDVVPQVAGSGDVET